MEIKARIPGKVISINVKVGDTVKSRSVLVVLEAMKMEQPIASPIDGTVKQISVAVGNKVKNGDTLVVVD